MSLGHLALLLRASIPILASLGVMLHQEECLPLKDAWEDVRSRVDQGHYLSRAMGEHPQVFPKSVLLMVQAGEESGELDDRLQRAASMLERQAGYEEKLRQALSGPVITCAASLLLLFGMGRYVMPRFVEMYSSMNLTLPWLTSLAVGLVKLLSSPAFPAFMLLLVALYLAESERIKRGLVRLLTDLPVVRPLVTSLLCAQFCDTIGALYANGIPVTRALRLLAATTWHPEYAQMLERAAERVEREGDLARAVEAEVTLFPRSLVSMLSVGAETGELEEVLVSIRRLMDLESESRLEVLLSLTEPFMVALLGSFLAAFFVAMLMPMYQLLSHLGS